MNDFKFEQYLDIFPNFTIRSNFAKLRLSAHSLEIEKGRYGIKKTPREERYCLYCKSRNSYVLEDEVHFLVSCPLFTEERQQMLNSISAIFPSIILLKEQNLLIWLMSQEDVYCLEIVAKYCNKAFYIRERILKTVCKN